MRRQDWDLQLHNFCESRFTAPFEWGVNDCCLFVADAIQATTDVDMAADFRGQYDDQISAFKQIKCVTGGSNVEDVADFVFAEYGIKELPSVAFAQRGDVVVFDGDEGVALGLVYLNGVDAVFVTDKGLRKVPVLNCRRAWGIR